MPYETAGAPRNPFEAAKRRNVCFGQHETEPRNIVDEDVSASTNTHQRQRTLTATLSNQPMRESEEKTEVKSLTDKLPSPTRDEPELCDEESVDPRAQLTGAVHHQA